MIKKMAKVSISGNQEIGIKANLKMTIAMDTGKCLGEMEQVTKDNG